MELGDTRSGDWQRIEVRPKEQGAAYCDGDGDVLFLTDTTTRADLFNSLSETQCLVMAARLSAWAEMAKSAASTHAEMAQ